MNVNIQTPDRIFILSRNGSIQDPAMQSPVKEIVEDNFHTVIKSYTGYAEIERAIAESKAHQIDRELEHQIAAAENEGM